MTKLEKIIKKFVDDKTDGLLPNGETDRGGRWYPDEAEKASCCRTVRRPSRSWPWSLYKHCCTHKHQVTLYREQHSEEIEKAKKIILKDAPIHINDSSELIKYVAEKLLSGTY